MNYLNRLIGGKFKKCNNKYVFYKGGEGNMESVMLKHLVARYRMDKILLEKHPEKKMLLEKRIKQHEKDIVDYVTSDSFHAQLNLLTL